MQFGTQFPIGTRLFIVKVGAAYFQWHETMDEEWMSPQYYIHTQCTVPASWNWSRMCVACDAFSRHPVWPKTFHVCHIMTLLLSSLCIIDGPIDDMGCDQHPVTHQSAPMVLYAGSEFLSSSLVTSNQASCGLPATITCLAWADGHGV